MRALRNISRALLITGLSGGMPWLLACFSAFGCSSDDDLPVGELGNTSEVDGENLGPPNPTLTDPFWCVDEVPFQLPAPVPGKLVGFFLPVLEWSSRTAMAGRGLTALLCFNTDFQCARPLAGAYSIREGMLGPNPLPASVPSGTAAVPVPEGFDGFVQFIVSAPPEAPESEHFIPVNYYLGGSISGDFSAAPPVLMSQHGTWRSMLAQTFPDVDTNPLEGSGTVLAGVFDCNGNPVSNARVELSIAGQAATGVVPFLLPQSRIMIAWPRGQPLITGASGMVGYLGVPSGAVQLRAFREGEAVPFGTFELGSVPGQMSMGIVRPAYLQGANLANLSPFP